MMSTDTEQRPSAGHGHVVGHHQRTTTKGRTMKAMAVAVASAALAVAACATEADDNDDPVSAGSETTEAQAPEQTASTTVAPTTTAPAPPPMEGQGPSVVDVTKDDIPMLAYITANDAGRHCGITSYDSAGGRIELLVNTTEPYEGLRPLDFNVGEHTARLQVECEGAWRIDLRHIDTAVGVGPGETRVHRGDDVFVVRDADTLTITGNAGARHMGIHAYDIDNGNVELLVNTVDPYEGEVITPAFALIVVQAEGEWSVANNGAT